MFSLSFAQTEQPIFTIKDTLEYQNEVTYGKVGRLFVNQVFVDTVDIAYFGIQPILKDGLIYLRYSSYGNSEGVFNREGELYGFLDDYIYFKRNKKTPISKLVPYFDNYFSSPAIIGNTLYYWGLKTLGGPDNIEVYAIRYNFANAELDSLFLLTDRLETDNPSYFFPPFQKDGKIHYDSEFLDWIIDKSFTKKQQVTRTK